jgi:hypothetical protein
LWYILRNKYNMATPTLDQISKARTEARQFGDGTAYALDFTVDGTKYTFIPKNVASNGGVTAGDNTYLLPYFTSKENQSSFAKSAIPFDLSSNTGLSKYLQNQGQQTTGFLVPSSSVSFDSNVRTQPTSTLNGSLSGLKVDEKGDIVYGVSGGAGSRYLTTTGEVHDPRIEYSSLLGDIFGSRGEQLADFVNSDVGRAAMLAATIYAGGGFDTGSGTAGAGAGATGATGTGAGGLMTNAALDAQFIAADAAQLAGQGLSSAQIAQTLAASGVDSFIAADVAQLAAQGLGASQIASTLGATVPTSTAATGAGGLFTEGGLATGGSATGAGATGAAGAAAAGGAGGLTAKQMATAGLISGGLNLAGGLLQGETTKDAMNQLAERQAALAEKTLQMGKFQPVGVTTRFGTSAFTTDEKTGAITPSYTLTPEAKAYQDALAGMGTQALTAGQGIMNLGQQYVGESPEAVRQRYLSTQRALLAPQQEQTLATIRARQAATGRGGLATGATSPEAGGLMATNPEMAAYYNSLANTERQLAANAETQYQNQVNFGTGLLNQATTPFTNVFGAQKGVELAAQQPLELSTNFANTVATRGAAQGANYATAMAPSLQAQYNANNFNPWATALQGAGSNPLTGYGLMKLTGLG